MLFPMVHFTKQVYDFLYRLWAALVAIGSRPCRVKSCMFKLISKFAIDMLMAEGTFPRYLAAVENELHCMTALKIRSCSWLIFINHID